MKFLFILYFNYIASQLLHLVTCLLKHCVKVLRLNILLVLIYSPYNLVININNHYHYNFD